MMEKMLMKADWKYKDQFRLFIGDNRKVLSEFEDNTFDSCITDPPYELGFMGKKWDSSGIAFDEKVWKEVLRVLKPGGYLLSFGGTRTYHRVTCAIEDSGFEIRDCLMWIYGSGFPKSLDVSKAIDKELGEEREIVGKNKNHRNLQSTNTMCGEPHSGSGEITKPSSELAKEYDGWGTALKPAYEPIILARKPIEGTVAKNVMKYGTGGINIDGCRIGCKDKIVG